MASVQVGGLAGNYLLMMFYTTVAGWMLAFMAFSGAGTFEGLDAGAVEGCSTGFWPTRL